MGWIVFPVQAARNGDLQNVLLRAGEQKGRVAYNHERQEVQILDCKGVGVIASIAVPEHLRAKVGRFLPHVYTAFEALAFVTTDTFTKAGGQGNLDSRNGEAVMALLQDLNRNGSTICMVTHDARYAQHAGREVQRFNGKVVDTAHAGLHA